MALARFRLRLTFDISVDDMPGFDRETVVRTSDDPEEHEQAVEGARLGHEHQRRLLQALLANPDVLRRYARRYAADAADSALPDWEEMRRVLQADTRDEAEILAPLLGRLPAETRAHFELMAEDGGDYWNATVDLNGCFSMALTGASFVEARLEPLG